MIITLRERKPLIQAVVQYEHRLSSGVEQYKAIVQLIDGSRLHINEVWLNGLLHKYAYYWLTPTSNLIQGWDNAPHHPQIITSPHHTHTPNLILPSSIHSFVNGCVA